MKSITHRINKSWHPVDLTMFRMVRAQEHPAVIFWDAETDIIGIYLEDNFSEQLDDNLGDQIP